MVFYTFAYYRRDNSTFTVKTIFVIAVILLYAGVLAGCVKNEPWRSGTMGSASPRDARIHEYTPDRYTEMETRCAEGEPCSKALVEIFKEENGDTLYELGFIEFTERGNLFNDANAKFVLDRMTAASRQPAGVIKVMFIHGWKNNAGTENGNVQSFRTVLHSVAQDNELTRNRDVVGLYVGWRGMSVSAPLIKELSFWDRKAVAETIGKGGVTDLVLNLESMENGNARNILAVVGHSFGGAILLSAYSEIVLDRIHKLGSDELEQDALNMADAIVLLNPAIEANEILQIKEAVVKYQPWGNTNRNLLRVISTAGDSATHNLFPLGQFLGVTLTENQAELTRSYLPRDATLSEKDLDQQTAGNYPPFHTLEIVEEPHSEAGWTFVKLCEQGSSQIEKAEYAFTFPCSTSDPVEFVYTSPAFMSGHNDIFNENVSAYLGSVIDQALRADVSARALDKSAAKRQINERFERNFYDYLSDYKAKRAQ